MDTEYVLPYTGDVIKEKLEKVDNTVLYTAQSLTLEQQAQTRENIGIITDPDRHAEYFAITKDGVLSLKPEYRGASTRTTFPDAISDMGAGVAGSKNAELPKYLVIPEIVNDIMVDSLAVCIFDTNKAIEEVVLPGTITAIPNAAFSGCTNLKAVHNTENITELAIACFQGVSARRINFPNLKTMGGNQFGGSHKLVYVDIGKVESVPKGTFFYCLSLNTVKNRGTITSVADSAFVYTPKLNKVDFLKDVDSIGKIAFLGSDIEYPWDTLTDCTFGENATFVQLNPTDFWSACSFTPCENSVPTHLSQTNPLWADKNIGGADKVYRKGCALFTTMHMYSGMTGTKFESPEEFVELVRSKNPALVDNYWGSAQRCGEILRALGLNATHYTEYNQTVLQALYDALAAGGYAYHTVSGGTDIDGHSIMSYGITPDGELMFVDSTGDKIHNNSFPVPKYAIKYKNFIHPSNDITIVTQ